MSKPLPQTNELTRHFWSGCKEGYFQFQRCKKCCHKQFPPRYACTKCHSTDLNWERSMGRGAIHSFTVVHRAPVDAFKQDVPYVIAIVELEEGVRTILNLRGENPNDAKIGVPVQIFFESNEGEYPLPQAQLQPMFTYENFEVGQLLGRRKLILERPLVEQWLDLFPEDSNGNSMPPGMMAVIYSRAYSSVLKPRPAGNVHGEQVFRMYKVPCIGDQLITSITCAGKTLKGTHRLIEFSSDTCNAAGELMFSSVMTTFWAK